MTAALAIPGNTADTFLVHFFGTGLADDRYVVERVPGPARDGDIVPAPAEAPKAKGRGKAKHMVVSRKAGRGDAPRPHGDHHLHGAQHPRRPTSVGFHRRRPSLPPQAEGLTARAPGTSAFFFPPTNEGGRHGLCRSGGSP